MKARVITLIFLSAILFSCRQSEDKNILSEEKILIADNIIYDVVIKIPNPDDPWEVEKLDGYQGNRMIDEFFNAVYTEKMTAYDYHTGKRLSPEEVRHAELRPGFDRNNIGKIQFTENWYYDPLTMDIDKEVVSIVLGYEKREIDGSLIGYEAAFQLNFK
ncbi:MAG TPA: hypothetical protein ENH59_05190 [Bacteroidetes bacterium]|nr:hypothetical protein [Bacteroidota bacterium]